MHQSVISSCKKKIMDFFSVYNKKICPELIFFKGEEINPIYGVFTFDKREGFVIVVIISGVPEVSGFSPEGTLTEDMIDHNEFLKESFALFEKKLKNNEIPVKKIEVKALSRSESFNMLSTKWSQGYPFNLFVPNNLLVGCVATATAQIIRYFEMQPSGILPAYESTALHFLIPEINLDNYTYDWSLMPDTVNSSSDDEEKESVALISFHAAAGVKMDFRLGASAAFTSDAKTLMSEHFSFSSYMKYAWFSEEEGSYLDSDITNALYFEITNGRPVLVGGSAHAFIADGISDITDYFHFNFGHGGALDGYFLVSSPGSWSIQEMLFNIHTRADDNVNTTSSILSAESQDRLSHGDSLSIYVDVKNTSGRNVSVAACITTLSSAFLHKVSDNYTLSSDINSQHVELFITIPESASISPRKIQLIWKYTDEEYGWRLVESSNGQMDNTLPVSIIAHENNDILLSAELNNIINQSVDEVFAYDIEIVNTSEQLRSVKCVFAIIDKNDNIMQVIGESELTELMPGSSIPLSINCSLSGIKVNTEHQAKIFYSFSDDYRYRMGVVNDAFENMAIIWAVNEIGFRSDIVIAEINNFPADRILTWSSPFMLNVTIVTDGYTENTLPINNLNIIVYDGMYNVTMLKNLSDIAISDQSTFDYQFPISVPASLRNGRYNFAITFSTPQHGHIHQIIKSDADIDNPVQVEVLQTILIPYLRLSKNLVVPDFVNSDTSFLLTLYFRLDAEFVPDGIYYLFRAEVLLMSGNDHYTIGSLGYGIKNNHSTMYDNLECDISNVPSGTYTLSVRVYDYYSLDESAILLGFDDSIIAHQEIIIS
nr:hypothetical protein 591p_00004 [Serratia proteamaculans]ULG19127.1 hypothetical protein Sm1ap2_00013 [Serratia proteamaculans]